MNVRVAGFVLALGSLSGIVCSTAIAASDITEAEKHAAEERALHAQIDQGDRDIQALESRLYAFENNHSGADPALAAKEAELREQIHHADREQEAIEDRLSELQKDDPPPSERAQAGHAAISSMPAPNPPSSVNVPAAPPPSAPPAPAVSLGPPLRSAVDPAPYLAAVDSHVSMFLLAMSPYRYVPIGPRQLVVFNTYDEAYLLDFADDCPGLLTTKRFRIESFSTHVVINRDAVIADGQHCLITGISELITGRLPNP